MLNHVSLSILMFPNVNLVIRLNGISRSYYIYIYIYIIFLKAQHSLLSTNVPVLSTQNYRPKVWHTYSVTAEFFIISSYKSKIYIYIQNYQIFRA